MGSPSRYLTRTFSYGSDRISRGFLLRGDDPSCPDHRIPASCAGVRSCLSSFDDRPGHFVAPWTYDTITTSDAVQLVVKAVQALGGDLRKVEGGESYSYVYATWTSWQGTDDVEFLLPDGDSTVGPGLQPPSMFAAHTFSSCKLNRSFGTAGVRLHIKPAPHFHGEAWRHLSVTPHQRRQTTRIILPNEQQGLGVRIEFNIVWVLPSGCRTRAIQTKCLIAACAFIV